MLFWKGSGRLLKQIKEWSKNFRVEFKIGRKNQVKTQPNMDFVICEFYLGKKRHLQNVFTS